MHPVNCHKERPLRIFESSLTKPPRYYATRTYRSQIDPTKGVEHVVVTGRKWDVTEEIERIMGSREKLLNRLIDTQRHWCGQARQDVANLLAIVLNIQTEPITEKDTQIVNDIEERYRDDPNA